MEVPEQDEHLSLLSIYGYWLVTGYFGVVKSGGISFPSFLGGFRSWGLVLTVWTPLWEVVLIWLASRWGEMLPGFFVGTTQTPRVCREGKTGLALGDFKFSVSVL